MTGRRLRASLFATAVEETLKFVPPEGDRVPAAAFTSLDGRAMYDGEPGRFSRIRIAAIRVHYAEQFARW